ncbi:MAG TPA: hypothetical protein VHP38_07665 [Ruminiclostridium sp.]|nr:hypothetical protein [Ruminiclostridium sp.]
MKKALKMDFSPLGKTSFQKVIDDYQLKQCVFSAQNTDHDHKIKIEIPNIKSLTSATYNTDDRSNLLVTVFARASCSKAKELHVLAPGYPQMLSGNIPVKRKGRVTEHFNACTSQLPSTGILHRESVLLVSNIVPRLRRLPKKSCTRRAKTAPCYAPYVLW